MCMRELHVLSKTYYGIVFASTEERIEKEPSNFAVIDTGSPQTLRETKSGLVVLYGRLKGVLIVLSFGLTD